LPQAESEPPAFQTVAIIGVGLIGGSLGLALKQRRLAKRVIGVTRRAETLQAALSCGAIDQGSHDPAEAVSEAALVFLCAPVKTIIEQLEAIKSSLPAGCLVTDVGSTKLEICSAASELLPTSVTFIGGHPMAGSEASGVAAARADLFEQATWLLTPTGGTPGASLDRLSSLISALGAKPLVMTPEEHDELTAAVSHIPHLLAAALVNLTTKVSEEHPEALEIAAGGFRDMTRIALGEPGIWRDVFLSNREAVLSQLVELKEEIERLADRMRDGDAEGLQQLLAEAAQARAKLNNRQ